MSETDPKRPPFLRRVTFVDTHPDDPSAVPVSVPVRLLLDGVDHSEILALDPAVRGRVPGHEWQVTGEPAVLVSFVAYAEHVTTQSYPSKTRSGRTVLSGSHVAGIPVLTPTDREWEILPPDAAGRKLVRVVFFAQRVEIVAANQLPESIELSRADTSN